MGDLKTRAATEADIATIAACWHAGWHQAHADVVPALLVSSRVMAEFTERTAAHLKGTRVAERDGVFAGFYMIEGDELYQFYVDSGFQGQGVALALIRAAEAEFAGRTAWLACSVGNDRAAAFYDKAGWSRTGEVVYPVESAAGPQEVTVWRYEKDLR